MDYKRLILIGLLAFIGLQLWNAWEADYPRVQNAKVATTTTKNEGFGVHDIANEQIKTSSKQNEQVLTENSSSQGQEVHVKTDVLDITIDTKGGTVTDAQLLDYPQSVDNKKPYQMFATSPAYYYVAQSGLEGRDQSESIGLATQFQVDNTNYNLVDDAQLLSVDLKWQSPQGLKVIKRFELTRSSYVINVSYIIENLTDVAWIGKSATQLKRINNPPKSSFFQISAYFGAAISSSDDPYQKIPFKKMDEYKKDGQKKGLPQGIPLMKDSIKGGWVAMQEHYFLSAWVPDQEAENYMYYDVDAKNNMYVIGVKGPLFEVQPNSTVTTSINKLYVGPELPKVLASVAPNLDLTIDYGILWFLSDAIFWLMQKIYEFIGNWGWAIILVTVFIKLAFTQLSAKSYRSMAQYREKMQRVQPKLTALKERYSDDKQKFNQAMMDLYKKEKINPIPAGGCLPILVQLPVFIALYWVLIESVELRQAPFMLWITDLSVKDPYYILPILFGLTVLLQQKLNPPPPDPTQAKLMLLMPVFLTVLFVNFPAGLVLYMLTNSLISVTQQWYFMRSYEKKKATKKLETKKTKETKVYGKK